MEEVTAMTKSLELLLSNISDHGALKNPFYELWSARQLSIEQIALVERNYGAWVKSFPDALAMLLVTTHDIEAKTEYVKTLYSEMGYGNADKVHCVLLNNFFKELARKMQHEGMLDWEHLEREIELLGSTLALIEGEQDLYRDKEMSFGAQLALEWQAYTMLRKLYDGARNYLPLWADPDEFHEACEYFYAHIGATEKEHKEESLKAARRYAKDEVSLERIIAGYHRHLELIHNFWQGLHDRATKPSARSISASVTR